MKQRIFSILVIFGLVLSMFAMGSPVQAEDAFPSPDADEDGLSNDLETGGWYSLAGGPFVTDPRDADSDDDGLTDGEEKLFDTNPLDAHDPGIAVKYDLGFKTREYFSSTDPAYLSMKQGGDQYLMTEAFVVRRGATIHIAGPVSGRLAITGTSMTALTPVADPAGGGWTISFPANGTVGTYTATVTDGAWTKSLPLYVIFELPPDLAQDQVAAFLYDDDPVNKKDEVAVFWAMQEWQNLFTCPQPNNGICSNWAYHVATGYAQAFWTEQFTKSVFVDHAIKAIHGKTTLASATPAIANWTDTEFRTRSGKLKNSWTSAMNRWNDGTGITMDGGYCETTSTVFTTLLRSAGIAARPFTLDYNKTAGHGESGQIGTVYDYDHSTMMWFEGAWRAQRAYNGDEGSDLYYPWNHGTTGVSPLDNWRDYSGYYNDYYGDLVVSANAGWDFQNGNSGGGVVNTIWPISPDQRLTVNQDYYWKSNWPLQITQSPYVDILNCQLWKGDNWAPSEWSNPPVSNPAGRTAVQSYNLPAGIPAAAAPLENFSYNPRPTACSSSTPTDVCNSFKARWSTLTCTVVSGQSTGMAASASSSVANSIPSNVSSMDVNSILSNENNVGFAASNAKVKPMQKDEVPQLGNILDNYGRDRDGDGRYDELIITFEVTSPIAGEYQFGGFLRIGDTLYRLSTTWATLTKGKQTIEISFDGQQIGDNKANGPYKIEALWIAPSDMPVLQIVEPTSMLNYLEYKYLTKAFKANQFKIQAAAFTDTYSHQGIDKNGNGLYEAVLVNTPLKINLPGKFKVEGDLYNGQGDFVDHATWTGDAANAALEFKVTKTRPPYTVEHLTVAKVNGEILDSRYAPVYEIKDLPVESIEGNTVELSANVSNQSSNKDQSRISIQKVAVVTPEPGSFTISPVDTNGNGLFDRLVVDVGVTLTETNDTGDYKIEALLEDEYGREVAWTVSGAKHLVYGVTGQKMRLEFDGKMLYDQFPLTGTRALRLVAVKIFSGNLSSATFESEVKYAVTTPAYSRSQFEPSSPAVTRFQDDLEGGSANWSSSSPWSLDTGTWNSWNHAWKASATGSANGSISLASPLDLGNYAVPELRFNNAYKMNTASGKVEVSTDGTNWTTLATYTGSTQHWKTEQISLGAYSKTANVQLRFNAQSTNGMTWYVDDVYINAWPAVKAASFTYPTPVVSGADTTLTASYTSVDTSLPVIYKWNFCGVEQQSSTPDIMYRFTNAGDCLVTLTVQNPYDGAVAPPQTIYVSPSGNQFILNVDITPSGGGTVTKSPNRPAYNLGEIVTLTATPATGYTWGGWSGGGCSGTDPCAVTMDANKVVTANFTPIEYNLTINTTGSGTVAKSPDKVTYHYGEVVQLTGVPDEHWSFASWSGDLTGITNPQTITINGNKTVNATFVQSDFTLAVTTVGSGTVTKNPDHAFYPVGENVSLTATPALGWSFSSWSGDLSGSTNPTSIIMTGSKSVTATFTQNQYTFTTNIVGQGTVGKSPDKATYVYGDQVTLTPTPATGWSFSTWGGDCSGSGACIVTMNGNKTVSATFTQNQYTLTVNITPSNGGTIVKNPDQSTYTHGQQVTLTATPAVGYSFGGWSGACGGSGNCLVTMDGNKTVTATFNRIQYTLAVTIVGNGQVLRNNDGPYYYGDVVQLTAQITSGWSFNSWSGDLSGNTNPASITMDGNKSVTATFTEDSYTLTVLIDGGGHVTVNPPGPYRYHSMPLLTAYPDPGWTFTNWTGDRTGTANPIEVTVNYNSTVTAHFTATPYTFTTSLVGQGTVSKSPEKSTYTYGDQVTVTATPAEGWSFDHWSGSCTGNGPCVVTVDGNESVEATFLAGANTLDVTKVGNGTVTKSPDQPTYVNGATVALTATADPGWEFTGWSGDVTSTENPLTVTMEANKAITATFTQLEFALTINQTPGGTITFEPAGPYTYGAVVTLTATPDAGYTFTSWGDDASGTTSPTTIEMVSDKTVSATFTPIACYVPRLIAAIEAANADPDATTIDLDANCSYTLAAAYAADPDGYGPVGLPPITTPVTLVGSNTTITRTGTAAFRFFYVTSSGSLTIENATLSNGLAHGGNGGHAQYDGGAGGSGMGGAIFNRGALTLTNVTLTGNKAIGGNGGNDNTVAITADAGGGGMGGDGQNAPGNNLGGNGGGINGGTGGINGSNNGKPGGVGGGGGGGAYAGSHGVGGAGGFGGGGGGGSTGGTGGFGGGGGGGQDAPRGGTPGFGGGRGQAWVGGGGAGFGGAVFNDGGTLTVTNSTLSSNTAQGGSGTVGTGGNNPTGTGGGGSGYGGAVFNRLGTMNITSPTYTNNTVLAGTGGVAGGAVAADVYDYVEHTLIVNTTGSGTVTRSSAGPYYNGDVVTLTATPATGYTFTGWSGDLSGTTSQATITMDGNKTVTATFEANPVTLTISQSPGGTITAAPSGPYHNGDVVTLTAAAETGYTFTGWTGDLSGTTTPTTITLNGDKTVGATFEQGTVNLTVTQSAGGTITADPVGPYHFGDVVTLTVAADTGYTFTGWTGDLSGTTTPTTITLNGDKTVGATFTPNAVTLTINQSTGGTITAAPSGPYDYGDEVTLTAMADTGYTFTGWTGDISGTTSPTTITLNGNKTVSATFEQNIVILTINEAVGGAITAAPAGPYHFGDVVTLTAAPSTGYVFTNWTNDLSGTTSPTTLTLNGDKTVGATFTLNTYTLTVVSDHGVVSKVPDQTSYAHGTSVLLTMGTVESGWNFTGWDGGGCTGIGPCTVTMYAETTVTAAFTQNVYNLTIETPTGGTITATPAGPYHYGDVVTVEAKADTGYTFTGWTGDLSGTTNPTTIIMVSDKTVGATFDVNVVTLTINQSAGGTITASPAGPYHLNDQVTLTATADTGYTFTAWTGALSGTTSPATLRLDGDKTVGATYELNTVTLIINQATGGTITASPAGPYHYGDTVTLTAAPDTGYTFGGWGGDASGTTSPTTIALNGDKTVTATFELQVVTLTIDQATGGTITAAPGGPYHYGDVVTVEAKADTGYTFTGWTGDLSGTTNPTTITLIGNKTISATYELQVVTLTINQATGGTITPTPTGTYHYGDVVTVEAVADTGYDFAGWTGDLSGTTNPTTITLNGDKAVGATFEFQVVTLTINQVMGGTIEAAPGGPYHYGDEVTLTATADAGYTFTSWTGDASGTSSPTTVILNGDKIVGGTFALNAVTLTIKPATGGTITADPAGPYHYGDEVTLTATADTGYTFTSWTDDASGTSSPTTITLNGDRTVGATFELNTVALTITSATGGTITATPAGPYHYGDVVSVEATAETGYTFTGWTGDLSGMANPTTIMLSGDRTISATFAFNTYTLTVIQPEHGSITPETASYNYGTEVTLTVTPAAHYHFVEWTGACTGNGACSVTVDAEKTVSATFAIDTYTLTVNQPANGTIAPVTATYDYGTVVQLTATPSEGFSFTGWSGDLIGLVNPKSITMDGNKTVSANFMEPCSTPYLVAIIEAANAEPDANTLELAAGCSYALTAAYAADPDGYGPVGLPAITTPVSLVGNASTITRSGTTAFRFFYVATTGSLTLENLTLSNGLAQGGNGGNAQYDGAGGAGGLGGAIFNRGALTLASVTLTGNKAIGGNGGNDNSGAPASDGGGGGMGGNGQDGQGSNNGGKGGGINGGAGGTQTSLSGVAGGVGGGGGGAAFNGSTQGNGGAGGFGGGGGGGTIGGTGGFGGGGGGGQDAARGGTPGFGGGRGQAWTGGGGAGFGGAVFNDGGTLTLTDSTLSSNTAQGGNGTVGSGGNNPTGTGGGGSGFGGAIFNHQGTLQVSNPTYTGNTVVAGTGGVSGTSDGTDVYDETVLTLTINITGQGTVLKSPDQPAYAYGTAVTLTPSAATGYTFTGWSGACTGSGACVVTMNGNQTVGATFTINTYTLTVTAVNGTVTKSPEKTSYTYGEQVQLTAVPLEGYRFSVWSGALSGTTNPATITMDENKSVTATFALIPPTCYTLTVSHTGNGSDPAASPANSTGCSAGQYLAGESISLTAVPDTGWQVASWTGTTNNSSTEATNTLTMPASAHAASAVYTRQSVTLTVNVTGSGTVNQAPVAPYLYGDSVQLTANPATGWHFVEWTGDLTGTQNPGTITLEGNKTVTAVFAQDAPTCYALTLSHTGNGSDPAASPANSTNCPSGSYVVGETITLSATPDSGWKVSGWTGTTNDSSTAATNTLTMPASAHEAAVNYAKIQYTLTVTPPDGGTITPPTATYNYGTVVTLTATPADGHHFVAWTGACTGSDPCNVTMDADKAVSATFAHDIFTLTVNQSAGGTIAPTTTDYEYGAPVTLTATPASGYHFVAWTDACNAQTGQVCNLTITDNLTVGATFELTPVCYALTLGHTGNGSDPVATPTNSTGCAAGTYLADELISLSGATPANGYEIGGWTGTTDDTSKASTNTLTMPANEHSVAVNYSQIEYTLTVTSEHGTVNVSEPAPYHYNDTITITMGTVQAGWTFTGWGGAGCTGTIPCTVTITGNTEVTANFTETEYALNITQPTGGAIIAEPGGPYHLSDPVTLTATANLGYNFSAWTDDCAGQGNPCSLTMDAAKTVSATFTQNHYTLEVISDHGSVSKFPDQTDYTYNQTVLLTMGTVDVGWTFTGWTSGGCSGTDPCTVSITGNTTVTAEFSQDDYSLTVAIDPVDSGNSVTISNPGPNYHYGDIVTLTPAAASGWQFDYWDGAVQDNKITITSNMVVTAYFTKIPYTLTLNASPAEGGTISANKENPVFYNDVVTVTEAAAPGYTFSHWEGACTGSEGCTVTITGDATVTAVFTQNHYTLNVTVNGNGTVDKNPNQDTYTYNQVVSLTATADPGWTFTGWDGSCSGNGGCQVTMDENRAVTAIFTEDQYILDITRNGSGTVSQSPNQPTYTYGQEVTLTATPESGWEVSEWSVEGCAGNTCTVTMYGDQNVIVTFTEYIVYTLTTIVDPEGSGTIIADPGGPTYPRDTMVRLTVNPEPGHFFDHWTGDCAGQGNPCTVTMNGGKTATAYLTHGKHLLKNLITAAGTLREDFESSSDWVVSGSGSGFKAEQDTVNKKEGSASIKLSTPASGNVTITKNVAWDLSTDQGNIRFWVYASGTAEPTGGSIILYTNASDYFTTSYGGAFKLRYKPGWNLISLRTSDWKATGSPSWATITSIRIRLDSRAANTYSFDELASGVVAQPAVIFTFDKGLTSLYTQAFSYMSSHNVRGTGYVITNLADTTGYARWDQLQAMKVAGWTIGSQTMSSVDLTTLDLAGQTEQLEGAKNALASRGLDPCQVAYPGGKYNANTLSAMASLGMCTGRTLLTFNNVSPLASPFEIAQRTIVKSTTLSTTQSWVDTAKARQEILVITIQGLSASPSTNDWYISRFQSLVSYCIDKGIPIITMDDLYDLQSGDIDIPEAK